ncbi:MAG: hypothetical protein GY953_19910, partial [bacterium]|nr:hypothetical protein [bacterium]
RIEVEHQRKLATRDAAAIETRVAHMFRLDEDFREFYALCRKRGGRWRPVASGLGRMVCSPTLFEDIVKVICTTNIQWSGTMKMVSGLVERYGERGSFPSPEAIAGQHPDEFAASVRMGYRAPYVHQLAERAASGSLDPDSLRDPALPTPDLKKRLLTLKGIGPYAAATLLMLLGRYDELPIDTVCRDFAKTHYFNGRTPTDAEILSLYDDWGRWRCLAYWFDMLAARNAG